MKLLTMIGKLSYERQWAACTTHPIYVPVDIFVVAV
jgi:hypothetical protein